MKKNTSHLFLVLIAAVGLLAFAARAELGLTQIMANQGAPALGQAVLTASKSVYAGNTDPVAIQNQLTAILNEAAATGNDQAIRYAIVAVMMAGGVENLALSQAAINNSNAFSNFQTITVRTVAATKALMTAAGGSGGAGDANKGDQGSKNDEGGGDPDTQGGGSGRLFLREVDPGDPFTWGTLTGLGDGDLPATRI